MAKLVYADAFLNDLVAVEQASKRDEIFDKVDLLADFPDLGSANLPVSILSRYGTTVRKLVVSPFDVVYEYDPASDEVHVLGLIHQRSAY